MRACRHGYSIQALPTSQLSARHTEESPCRLPVTVYQLPVLMSAPAGLEVDSTLVYDPLLASLD